MKSRRWRWTCVALAVASEGRWDEGRMWPRGRPFWEGVEGSGEGGEGSGGHKIVQRALAGHTAGEIFMITSCGKRVVRLGTEPAAFPADFRTVVAQRYEGCHFHEGAPSV